MYFFALIKSNQILNHSILQLMFNCIVLYTIHYMQSSLQIFFLQKIHISVIFSATQQKTHKQQNTTLRLVIINIELVINYTKIFDKNIIN